MRPMMRLILGLCALVLIFAGVALELPIRSRLRGQR